MFMSPIDTSALDAGASTTSTKGSSNTDPSAAQDRFLKLLVAQLNNQDPMNPLDNAQMTSQMAQINTVTGIQQLNLTMVSMAEQFASMQAMQGTMLLGRSVQVEGDSLAVEKAEDGSVTGKGAFELGNAASNVKVDILSPGGQVVGSVELGAQESGMHPFTWDASKYAGDSSSLRFRVTATNKEGAVESRSYMQSKVVGTSVEEGLLTLNLASGASIKYRDVRSVV